MPGVIESIIDGAPLFSRVVVVGCRRRRPDPASDGAQQEIDLRFVLGYTPLEFRDTLHMIAAGKVDPSRSSPDRGLDGARPLHPRASSPRVHCQGRHRAHALGGTQPPNTRSSSIATAIET